MRKTSIFLLSACTLVVLVGCGQTEEPSKLTQTKKQPAASDEMGGGSTFDRPIDYPNSTCGEIWKEFHREAPSKQTESYLDDQKSFRDCSDELVPHIEDEYESTQEAFRSRRYNLTYELGASADADAKEKLITIASKSLPPQNRENHVMRSVWGEALMIRAAAIGGLDTISKVSGVSVVASLEEVFENTEDRPVQSIVADSLLKKEGYTEDHLLSLADATNEEWVEDVLSREDLMSTNPPPDPPLVFALGSGIDKRLGFPWIFQRNRIEDVV